MCPIVGSGVRVGMAVAGCSGAKVEIGVVGGVNAVSPEQAASAANATRAIGRTGCLRHLNNDVDRNTLFGRNLTQNPSRQY